MAEVEVGVDAHRAEHDRLGPGPVDAEPERPEGLGDGLDAGGVGGGIGDDDEAGHGRVFSLG